MLRRRFTAAMHGRPRKLALIVPLDLGVCLVDHRVEIAAVEQLKAAPDELGVSLPSSPPGAAERP